jgi:transcriptional regulator with XRE-family HTH domain
VNCSRLLTAEFERRRSANPRYSLRAFARDLSVDHSTLSRLLRGKRRLTVRTVRALGAALRLPPRIIAELCALENEAAVLSLLTHKNFQPESRWVSTVAGIPLDEVNITLHRLLRKRTMVMRTTSRWQRVQVEEA